MSGLNVLLLLRKELRDALRNRWVWLFAVALAGLALALGGLGLSEIGGGLAFSRTLAGLINLTLLLVPLLGLALGAQSVAGERERRTLAYLLAQPLGRAELLLGKFLGLALAVALAIALGFGGAGLVLLLTHLDALLYLALVALALLLGLACLSLGLLVSVLSRKVAAATAAAVVVWFVLVLLADLGVMGTTLVLRLRAELVLTLALLNPLQAYKLAAVLLIRPSMEVLGPAGMFGVATFGPWFGPLLVGLLLAWTLLPLGAALLLFRRGGEA